MRKLLTFLTVLGFAIYMLVARGIGRGPLPALGGFFFVALALYLVVFAIRFDVRFGRGGVKAQRRYTAALGREGLVVPSIRGRGPALILLCLRRSPCAGWLPAPFSYVSVAGRNASNARQCSPAGIGLGRPWFSLAVSSDADWEVDLVIRPVFLPRPMLVDVNLEVRGPATGVNLPAALMRPQGLGVEF